MKQNMETTTSALPERVLYLCACAAWAAKGDLEHLETAIPQALDHGVTINELKDAFAQLYAYAGFPRSLNALGVLGAGAIILTIFYAFPELFMAWFGRLEGLKKK